MAKSIKRNGKRRSGGAVALIAGLVGGAALASYLISRKKKSAEITRPLVIAKNGKSKFKIVFNHALDSVVKKEGGTIDIEVKLANDLSESLCESLGVELEVASDISDADGDDASLFEILVGDTARIESELFRRALGYAEYGFEVIGNKVVISGTNLTTTERAVELFAEYAKEHAKTDEEGNKTLVLSPKTEVIAEADDWFIDIPEYKGGSFAGTLDADLGTLVIRYTNTTADEFEAYCEKLESKGYKLWQRNDIVGNLHAFYTGEKGLISVCYADCEGAVRIATSKAGAYALPAHPQKEIYTKVTKSLLVQLACDYSRHEYGMGYIVVLENGSFVIFDGGDNRNTGTFVDLLYDKLKSLNKRPDGKIVIEAWFISHTHVDHYGTFANFCYKYGKEVTIGQVLLNTTSKNYEYSSVSPDRYIQNNMQLLLDSVPGMEFVKVHSGMRFHYANAEFEILHTPEDLYPQIPLYFNDTSIVWRMTLDGQTSIWLGDVAQRGSGVMCAKYGEYLKSDIVQVSHHGYVGGTVELYALIDGKVALWPVNQRWYDMMIEPNFTYYNENIEVVNRAYEILVAEEDFTLALPYTAGTAEK